ncbi:OLC1v1019921C1 [Oldenlandia corymbosa var. corymbosa]|uniref:OLC1v1019921C1 n=1 Tax=Oldenlandia corymbosa var. corymbosa TaxID=529605 RepID=A0AAV1EF59_OLDCO|nr:OLC1v1019921C1 [Oldenlandia corymbosa var. corymbosa]
MSAIPEINLVCMNLVDHLNKYKRKWRSAFVAIYCTRAFNKRWQQPIVPYTALNVTPDYISDLVRQRNIDELNRLGGILKVASILESDIEKGILGDESVITRRRVQYGSNRVHQQSPKLLHDLAATVKDPGVILLSIWGMIALCFGIKHYGGRGISDGVSICLAALLAITLTAFANHWPKTELFKLSKDRDDFNIHVQRNNILDAISVFEAVVGDVVVLNAGDQIPADGLIIGESPLLVDESNVRPHMDSVEINGSGNPFLLSGTKVINGSARMIVTAVGEKTKWGNLLISESYSSEQRTPLQMRLHKLSKFLATIGFGAASIVLAVLLARYFTGNFHDGGGNPHFVAGNTNFKEVFRDLIGIVATPVAIASTAIQEGLLLAVLINISFSAKKINQNAQLRKLSACEAIGNTTVIILDEKLKLTLDHLAVTSFYICAKHIPSSEIPKNVLQLLSQAIILSHSEASSSSRSSDGEIRNAIQKWGDEDLGLEIEEVSENYTMNPHSICNSGNSGSWIKKKSDDSLHVHQNGDAEDILEICSHYYDESGDMKEMVSSIREEKLAQVKEMKSKVHRCIAFAHKSVTEESNDEHGNPVPEVGKKDLVFIGIACLNFPCRPAVRMALEELKRAEVDFKIITRNDTLPAKALAMECGFLEDTGDMNSGEVVEGPVFRSYTHSERLEKCQKIRVMARASTIEKHRMVQCLIENGEVVAVTGSTTGDASVLKVADVGFSLGSQGTQQAMASSNVVIKDDDFESIPRIVTWGRAINHKTQLYAQFQITVFFSSLVTDVISAVSAKEPPNFNIVTAISSGKVTFAAVQVLWAKLVVGMLAAIAITIEDHAELKLLPKAKRGQLLSNAVWENIAAQSVYPIVLLLTIQFKGKSEAFRLDSGTKDTMIFNIFVLWQLCLMLNTKGFHRNFSEGQWRRRKLLGGIIAVIILVQVLMVQVLHKFANTKPLNWKLWMICVALALLTCPIGCLIENVKHFAEAFSKAPSS